MTTSTIAARNLHNVLWSIHSVGLIVPSRLMHLACAQRLFGSAAATTDSKEYCKEMLEASNRLDLAYEEGGKWRLTNAGRKLMDSGSLL